MANVHVKGLAELQRALDEIPAKMEANVLRGALRAGANIIRDHARENVPVATGTLRDGLKVSTRSRRGRVTATLKTTGKHAFIAPWIEFGTRPHRIVARGKGLFFGGLFARGVDHPGAAAKPFLRPALDARATAAVVAAGNHIKRRLATKHGINTPDLEIEA